MRGTVRPCDRRGLGPGGRPALGGEGPVRPGHVPDRLVPEPEQVLDRLTGAVRLVGVDDRVLLVGVGVDHHDVRVRRQRDPDGVEEVDLHGHDHGVDGELAQPGEGSPDQTLGADPYAEVVVTQPTRSDPTATVTVTSGTAPRSGPARSSWRARTRAGRRASAIPGPPAGRAHAGGSGKPTQRPARGRTERRGGRGVHLAASSCPPVANRRSPPGTETPVCRAPGRREGEGAARREGRC